MGLITSQILDVYLNGNRNQRYPGNINLSFAYIEDESMILAVKDLAVSSGSACTSSSLEPSYVLQTLRVDEELAHTSLIFGVVRFTLEDEIDYEVELIISKIKFLREMSPHSKGVGLEAD